MLSDLLWFLGAKQQYEGQKSAGLAGLLALILTFVAVWKWENWVYPVLKWSGLVGFADRLGLISESSHVTMFNVSSMVILLIFAYAILCFATVFIGLLISSFLSSKVGMALIGFILFPIIIVPVLIYGHFWKKKQDAPKKPTKSEQFRQELETKQHNAYMRWLEIYNNAPQVDEISEVTKGMKGFRRSLYIGTLCGPDATSDEVTHYFQWGSCVRNIEPRLDKHRDNVIAFNCETGKFSMVLPNPLPVMVSSMFDKHFEDEETLLNALHLFKTEFPEADYHVFPTLELEVNHSVNGTYLSPVKNAVITPLSIADADKTYRKFRVKDQSNFYRTIEALNEREDVQDLLNRVNLNTLLLNEIVEAQGIEPKPTQDPFAKTWGNLSTYKDLFSGQLSAAFQHLNNNGYKWRVSK